MISVHYFFVNFFFTFGHTHILSQAFCFLNDALRDLDGDQRQPPHLGCFGQPDTGVIYMIYTPVQEGGKYRYLRGPQGYHGTGDAYTRRFDDITTNEERYVRCIDDGLLYDCDRY